MKSGSTRERINHHHESSELKLLKRNKVKSFKSTKEDINGPKIKRQRFGSRKQCLVETTVINVTPVAQDETAHQEEEKVEEKDPIIRVYSEDSAYVDTAANLETNRISFRLSESMPSQDTDLTELRMSSFYSQDDMLAKDIVKTKTMMTMSSVMSTELDTARSHDCLVKEKQSESCQNRVKRASLCFINYIIDFVRTVISSDYDSHSHKLESGDMTTYIGPRLMANFRGEGKVTTGCLWHACRAVTIGIALIITGISLTIIGYLTDQQEYLEHVELSRKFDNYTSTKYKDGRFHLSNISFSGPVVLGTGGFLVIVACVMTLEARDNAAKIVPATATLETAKARPVDRSFTRPRESRFKTSASQTANLDKGSGQSSESRVKSSGERRFSSGSAQPPDTSSDQAEASVHVTDGDRTARTQAYVNGDCGGVSASPGTLHKCPSAPCISFPEVRSEVCSVTYQRETSESAAHERWNNKSKFRVLTPTMYRSRMASTRQTLSMDCGSSIVTSWSSNKTKQLIRPEDSLDLELGASASHVDKNSSVKAAHVEAGRMSHSRESLLLDLHVQGSAPITLLVRDESRSNKSCHDSPSHINNSSSGPSHLNNNSSSAHPTCGDTCCPTRGSTVKQVSWGSTSSLANDGAGEGDWWPGHKLSLPVPPPGILRTSSPHSSSSPADTSSGPAPESSDRSEEKSPRPCYSARSDTVLEMCSDIEDISFIDEDEEEEEVVETKTTESLAAANNNVDNNPGDEIVSGDEKQQIVIKLNNEIELTSILVNTQSLGQRLPTSETTQQTDEVNQPAQTSDPTYDEISETSFNIGNDITLVAPEDSSSSSETVASREHEHAAVSQAGTKKRNVLVRQRKLDSDLHPDTTRPRHSLESCLSNSSSSYPQQQHAPLTHKTSKHRRSSSL